VPAEDRGDRRDLYSVREVKTPRPREGILQLIDGCRSVQNSGRLRRWHFNDAALAKWLGETLDSHADPQLLGVPPTSVAVGGANEIRVPQVTGSTVSEKWFEHQLPLNPELIATIGNKGGGKSALADMVRGRIGPTKQIPRGLRRHRPIEQLAAANTVRRITDRATAY
jgi:hypothetical protein